MPSPWEYSDSYEDFVVDESLTEEVSLVRATVVVEDAPVEHFFDDRDRAAISAFDL
ncbi:hypothetical protein [Actinoplanes sp. GCM10030250]|uniref:hypothetical protein n=1 Tax=Actinoplanes sp. GCM10030250 TaxID=3273376 RepID=UPI003671E922